jgi:hypothetical protein
MEFNQDGSFGFSPTETVPTNYSDNLGQEKH